jgi:hypothetical protein
MKNRSQPFDCAIAGKAVGISLRHGGGLQEPEHVYVRCEERDCQYVDQNVAPCPLRVEMFTDGSDQRVAEYLAAHPGARFCYSCLTETLAITHDQVRRASWRVKRESGVSIRPARCTLCRHRRVTICVHRDGMTLPEPVVSASPLRPVPREVPSVQQVEAYLRAHPGYRFCAHCLARELAQRPADVREVMWHLEAQPAFNVRTTQCVSCLLSKPVVQYDEVVTEAQTPQRIINFLVQSSDLAFCATCVAFATDLGLAEVRRVFQALEPVSAITRLEGACGACGRWQPVMQTAQPTADDAARLTEIAEVLTGYLRYRGFRIDLLSFRTAGGWRPFALIRSGAGTLIPEAPPLVLDTMPTKIEADEVAMVRAREWIDKRIA